MYWYVLFVRTGYEKKVKLLLEKQLDNDFLVPFIPMHEILFKMSGQVKKELKPLFPGYLFVECRMPGNEFIKKIKTVFSSSKVAGKLLRYCNTEIAMRESEKQILLRLCNEDNCIESSLGIKEGNRIYITEGPLKGRESIIKKIDRHKKRALVELNFMKEVRMVSLAIEVVEKA